MRTSAAADIVLAAGARTPIGRLGGALAGMPGPDLGAAAVRATLGTLPADWSQTG